MQFRLIGLILMFSFVTSSCSGGGGGADQTPTTPNVSAAVASISITLANPALILGQSTQLTVVSRDASGNVLSGRVISFASSNNSVATVSSSGSVTAVGAGTASISATSEGISASAPVTVTLAPIATVTFAAATASILGGQTLQLNASIKDANGNVLSGRTVSYSSSSANVATVNASGLVTALLAGTTTITATSEGVQGAVAITVVDPRNIPTFNRPFTDEFPVINFMDHDFPKEFIDMNGTFLTSWGESHANTGGMTDGHSGYDFSMPVGTPLFADAAGTVVIASLTSAPFFCPPLNANVTDQADVYIEHRLIGGITIQSRYTHLSRIDVAAGQIVTAGQQIGLSGNSGCSTAPHLHYEIDRMTQTATGERTEIDPYGWSGVARDPWELSSIGATSINLWKPGQAPALFRQFTYPVPATGAAPLLITRIVYEGLNDAVNPNNEFIEITLDTRVASTASLNGYSLKGDVAAFTFAFPASTTITAANPVLRVYTGSGTNTATAIYMGRPSGVWSNLRNDCVRLVTPAGGQIRASAGGTCA